MVEKTCFNLHSSPNPFAYYAAVVSERVFPENVKKGQAVSVLCKQPLSSLSEVVIKHHEAVSYSISILRTGNPIIKGQTTLALVNVQQPLFEKISPKNWTFFQIALRSAHNENLLWLTTPSQVKCDKHHHAHTIGIARILHPGG